MKAPDYVRKRFEPMKSKGLRKELSRVIRHHFPRIGGSRIADLCADMVLEVVFKHLQPSEHLHHGQIVWLGFDIDDPPSRNKTSENVRLVPVVLDLFSDDDIDAVIDRVPAEQRLLRRCIRILNQAHAQKALLSNVDLAGILGAGEARLAGLIAAHEREMNVVLPRRATLHDVGSGVTHKRIICAKRYIDGKTSDVIARETHHSITSVDRYLGMCDRVRMCNRLGLSSGEIARSLGCTERLVHEYLNINAQLDEGELLCAQ
ncbi:MAG: DUF1670 domain-containing protein [Gemmatimonadaceae bacterium]|nr:DUF1670 domain-containing protein [Gemmatimonadaceae bacterium]